MSHKNSENCPIVDEQEGLNNPRQNTPLRHINEDEEHREE